MSLLALPADFSRDTTMKGGSKQAVQRGVEVFDDLSELNVHVGCVPVLRTLKTLETLKTMKTSRL